MEERWTISTEDDADLTMPEGGKPRPVPAGELETDSQSANEPNDTLAEGVDDTLAEGGDETLAEGEDSTLIECPDATLIEPGSSPTESPATAPSKKPQSGQIFADRFEVVKVLGEGGMGRVYSVRDRQIEGRRIALKVLRPRYSRNARFREMFFKEIQAAQGFVSEHVTQVRDTGQMKDGTLFLTMDLVEGESLDKVLERETSLTPRHALEITRQVLLGLASGHDKGFVHCDVKPPNVMLTARVPKTEENPFGVGVRVLDFGIASLAPEMEEGEVIGTPRYMSPEQVQGQRLDARSDIFATGVLLYEMLSGTRPFDGTTAKEVQTAVLETDVTPLIRDLTHLPEPIRKILAKALQKDREKRFQSAAEFIQAIEVSKSYTQVDGLPKWVAGLAVFLLITAGAEAALLWNRFQEVERLHSEKSEWISEARDEKTQAVTDAERAKDKLYGPQITNLGNQITKLTEERNDLQDQLDQIGTSEEIGSGDLETARTAFDATIEQYKKDYLAEKAAREDLASQVEALKKRQARTELKLTSEYQSAQFFDDLFGRIAGGAPDSALTYFGNKERDHALPISTDQGVNMIRELVEASAELAKAVPLKELISPGSDALQRKEAQDALRNAKLHLKAAEEQAKNFPLESVAWISEEVGEGSAAEGQPSRLERVTAQIAALKAALPELEDAAAAIKLESESARADELGALLAESLGSHPEDILAYIQIHGPEGLEKRLDDLGQWTERKLAPTGALDVDALTKSKVLATFGPWLLDKESAPLQSKGVVTLRWLLAARAWLAGETLPDQLATLVEEIPSITTTTPTRNWRAELALQVQLSTPSQYPETAGDAVLITLWNGNQEWVKESISAAVDGPGWVITRKRVGADGRLNPKASKITARRIKDMLQLDNETVLDLRSSTSSVALWQHELVQSLPDESWTHGLDTTTFDETLQHPIPCLVYKLGEKEYWYSPAHGLVRQTRGTDFQRELAFSSTVRR